MLPSVTTVVQGRLLSEGNAPVLFLDLPNTNAPLFGHDSRRPTLPKISIEMPCHLNITRLDPEYLRSHVIGVDLVCDHGLSNICHDRLASDPADPQCTQGVAHHFILRFLFAGSVEYNGHSTMHLDVCPNSCAPIPGGPGTVRCWSTRPPYTSYPSRLDSVISTAILINPRSQTGVTGKQIMDLVIHNNLNTFSFRNGGGCRHWIHEITKLMEEARMTRQGWSDDVLARMKHHWKPVLDKNPECVPLPYHELTEGVFNRRLSARQQGVRFPLIVYIDVTYIFHFRSRRRLLWPRIRMR